MSKIYRMQNIKFMYSRQILQKKSPARREKANNKQE